MRAEQVAQLVADTLSEHGYPYYAVKTTFDPPYPTVSLWDDRRALIVVIACSEKRYDSEAKDFANRLAATWEAAGFAPTGAKGYAAWPHSSELNAVSIPEWIVFDRRSIDARR